MSFRVRVDGRGRIVLPKEFRERLGVREGDEVVLMLRGDRIILVRAEDPFRVLESILGDLTFSRDLRRIAEREALREVEEKS